MRVGQAGGQHESGGSGNMERAGVRTGHESAVSRRRGRNYHTKC
jgi:hypothetical protein